MIQEYSTKTLINTKDYEELVSKASMTEDEIKEQARNLAEESNKVDVLISINLYSVADSSNSLGGYKYKMDAIVNAYPKDNSLTLTQEDTDKLADEIHNQAGKVIEKSFGEQITRINHLMELEEQYQKMTKIYKTITLTGWLLSIVILLASIIF